MLTPGNIEYLSNKIAEFIVDDMDRISWIDLYTGIILGYILASYSLL